MAVFEITVPNAVAPRVVEAFTKPYGYQPQMFDPQANEGAGGMVSNPVTPAQFAKQQIAALVKRKVAEYEMQKASSAAAAAAETDLTFT